MKLPADLEWAGEFTHLLAPDPTQPLISLKTDSWEILALSMRALGISQLPLRKENYKSATRLISVIYSAFTTLSRRWDFRALDGILTGNRFSRALRLDKLPIHRL